MLADRRATRRGAALCGSALCLAVLLSACGASKRERGPANPLRASIEDDIAALDDEAPLPARYNPAPCACPPLELRIGARWLRAAWVSSEQAEALARTFEDLAAAPRRSWPIPLVARGRVDPVARRTAQGEYAVLVDLSAIEQPAKAPALSPAPPPAPTPALEPATAEGAADPGDAAKVAE
jgi:hypothetical protein